jgi:hypothetical protein
MNISTTQCKCLCSWYRSKILTSTLKSEGNGYIEIGDFEGPDRFSNNELNFFYQNCTKNALLGTQEKQKSVW